MNATSVPPKSIDTAQTHVLVNHGRLMVSTCARTYLIDHKVWRKWQDAGGYLIKEEGDGYRMQTGKSSVYLFAGQLKMID